MSNGQPGTVTYLCVHDDHEWEARGVKYPENMDPAALDRGDDCPKCGTECDNVVSWEPDDGVRT